MGINIYDSEENIETKDSLLNDENLLSIDNEKKSDGNKKKLKFKLGLFEYAIIALSILFFIYFFWSSTPSSKQKFSSKDNNEMSSLQLETTHDIQQNEAVNLINKTQKDLSIVIKNNHDYSVSNRDAIQKINKNIEVLKESINNLSLENENLKQEINNLVNVLNELKNNSKLTPQKNDDNDKNNYEKINKNKVKSKLENIKVISVLNEYAWVKFNKKTWALREGDKLNGIEIKNIDYVNGVIETSAGLLKKE